MKKMTSRQKILFCIYAMILAMIGDYLLGFGTFSFSDSPDAYMGMTANVVPDWRYAVSSVLGFICPVCGGSNRTDEGHGEKIQPCGQQTV